MDELVLRVYAVNRERSIVKVDQHISSFLHTFSRRCFIPTRQKTTLTTNSKQGSSVLESKACSTSRAFRFFVSSTQSNTLSFSAHGSRLTAHGFSRFTHDWWRCTSAHMLDPTESIWAQNGIDHGTVGEC